MFKTLVKYIGEFKRDAILTPVLVVMEVIMEVIIPIIMAVIIDYGLESRSLGKVVLIGLAMIAAAMLALWFGVESGRTASSASSGFAMNLRQAMYEKIQAFSFSNIDKFSTAGLVTRMTTDVMNVQQGRADDSWNAGVFPAVFPFLQSADLAAFTAVEFYHYGDCESRSG